MARTRSDAAHDKVLRAALELFAGRGIDATSMDAIAQASGVSKATIYNHWADKEALLMEVMEMIHGIGRQTECIDTGDIRRDLTIVLTRKPPDEFDAVRTKMTPSLIAYSAVHTEFGREWRHRVMEPPRQCIRQILARGIRQGLLPRGLDVDAAISLLLGPVLYTHIFQKDRQEKVPDIGPKAAETFWRAYAQARHEGIEKAGIRKSSTRKPS
ncbi:MAG TPA: TetR/AcrR family transcriptional regulator [Terracidiphilus sp.]|nr:TetR/AcrR family transcriptional regulator [Terracidiphilus sp.]